MVQNFILALVYVSYVVSNLLMEEMIHFIFTSRCGTPELKLLHMLCHISKD